MPSPVSFACTCLCTDLEFLRVTNLEFHVDGENANIDEMVKATMCVINDSDCKASDTKVTVTLVGPAEFPLTVEYGGEIQPIDIDWPRMREAFGKQFFDPFRRVRTFDVGVVGPKTGEPLEIEFMVIGLGEVSLTTQVSAFLIPKGIGKEKDHSEYVDVQGGD